MSLLDSLPHKCTIALRTRVNDEYGGNRDTIAAQQTGVECWAQKANAGEINLYQKRGISVDEKVYFNSDPGLTEQHVIIITEKCGVAVPAASQIELDVASIEEPDSSAGLGAVWKAMCGYDTGSED